ncbi:nitroreductase family protein [Pseudonocardia hierapolitana]|uniref:Nitroreductase family protein n=1 Tax=Pseudonocardia hierapolitana TaxID=1128676 RepID=A0A561SJX0_9PSEU|nr:nitroreductase family protein [Pseudonocardia hierapolitana]TWF75150.1 nitroreductase family protein [Pseudonocardia hierapolitana]
MTTATQLADAVEDALHAPSVHNSQPWRWRIGSDEVRLHADPQRHLVATDPDRRDLVLSCGAALHHLRVALAARGLRADIRRLPDPEDSTHLATVEVRPGGEPADAALFPAIAERRTDRRRMSRRPVPAQHLNTLVEHAARNGATLVPVTRPAMRRQLVAAIVTAQRLQREDVGYASELRMWTNRLPGGRDGVPAANVAAPLIGTLDPSPLRRFGRAELAQAARVAGHGRGDDAAELLVVTTAGDETADRLRAGEATSAVLLAATRIGLATTPLSQAMEIDSSRLQVQRNVLGTPEFPQLVIRVGWSASGAPAPPATPRRELRSVLLP